MNEAKLPADAHCPVCLEPFASGMSGGPPGTFLCKCEPCHEVHIWPPRTPVQSFADLLWLLHKPH